jgi:hypothetical protein
MKQLKQKRNNTIHILLIAMQILQKLGSFANKCDNYQNCVWQM